MNVVISMIVVQITILIRTTVKLTLYVEMVGLPEILQENFQKLIWHLNFKRKL